MAEYARVAWAETYADLDARDLITKPRLNMIDRYVRARTEYEFLYPVAMHEGPTLTAESGGRFANMKFAAVSKLNEQIMKFEEALTISPKSIGARGDDTGDEKLLPASAQKYLARSRGH